jgi:hypothetical protein
MGGNARVTDAVQRPFALLRRAGTQEAWTPDLQRTTPQERRAAQRPGNVPHHPLAAPTREKRLRMRSNSPSMTSR